MAQCSPPSEESNQGLLFRYNEASGVSSLDPAFARDQAHNWVIRQLYTTLFETDSLGQLRGLLAESWSFSSGGIRAGIRIRTDFAAHQDPCFKGLAHAIDAYDVAASLQRLKQLADPPLLGADYLQVFARGGRLTDEPQRRQRPRRWPRCNRP